MNDKQNSADVEAYIAACPEESRDIVTKMRQAIREVLPGAEEKVSYGVGCFTLHDKYVVYFAGYKEHVSVYPIPSGDDGLHAEIEPYQAGKGTLRFPLDKPIPYKLIQKVAVALAQDSQNRVQTK